MKMLRYLIDNDGDWTSADSEGRTALHYAGVQKSTKCISAIVKSGMHVPQGFNLVDNFNTTALVSAIHTKCCSVTICIAHDHDAMINELNKLGYQTHTNCLVRGMYTVLWV